MAPIAVGLIVLPPFVAMWFCAKLSQLPEIPDKLALQCLAVPRAIAVQYMGMLAYAAAIVWIDKSGDNAFWFLTTAGVGAIINIAPASLITFPLASLSSEIFYNAYTAKADA